MRDAKQAVTLAWLNANDAPKAIGGVMLGEDGIGNQAWAFPGDIVANRYQNPDHPDDGYEWSGDVEGWGYPPEMAVHEGDGVRP